MDINRFLNVLTKPSLLFFTLAHRGLLNNLSDDKFLKIAYRIKSGEKLNLVNPTTFNEKIQWLKLNGFRPEYTSLVDKYLVKDIVRKKIGDKYIIPTLGAWTDAKEIDWNILPNQFVLKVNHNSGGLVICKDKKTLDKRKAEKILNIALRYNYYWEHRERPYKDVRPLIIAEKFMKDSFGSTDLSDYKFYCFNGEPKYCQVIRDRSTQETIDFYDVEWTHQNFVGLNKNCMNGKCSVEKPEKLDEMLNICRELSKNIPFVRIDLYYIAGQIYFGEITFYPGSGYGYFRPKQWNAILGDLIVL